jgi:hypothetical protein
MDEEIPSEIQTSVPWDKMTFFCDEDDAFLRRSAIQFRFINSISEKGQ